jgi:hypothetical protein
MLIEAIASNQDDGDGSGRDDSGSFDRLTFLKE